MSAELAYPIKYPRVVIHPRTSATNPHQMGKDFYTANVRILPSVHIIHRLNNIFIPQLDPAVYPTLPLGKVRA